MTMHTEADPTVWQGRVDAEEGALGQRWHQVVRSADAASPLNGAVDAGRL
ncbi:formimidoylglutamase, partial [Ralstonia solanacearum]